MFEDNKVALGKFEVHSGRMIVSDPCYAENLWCCNTLETVHNGTWKAYVIYDAADEYQRVVCLIVEHESAESLPEIMEDAPFCVGVDSGQAGFFDAAHYRDDRLIDLHRTSTERADLWYERCCQLTLARQQAGVLPYGTVSSSGYGDGCYDCFYQRDALGYIVRAEILFIDAEADDDDEFEE